MNNLLQALLDLIRKLLGGAAPHHECGLPADLELPSEVPYDDVPEIVTTAQAASFDGQAGEADVTVPTFSAQSAGCKLTIRPGLGTVNLRPGPGMNFEPPIAKTQGGVIFDLVGASEPDASQIRWYAVRLGTTSAWVRGDLVVLDQACTSVDFISAEDIKPAPPPPPDDRFVPPVKARISQGFRTPAHPALDLDVRTGTLILTPAEGTCIRRVECTKCTAARPNRLPNHLAQCPETWRDPGWGFGYGNFMIMRYDYARLPKPLRDEMDRRNLRNGFAYVLFAHLSRMNLYLGQKVRAGIPIAATGNTGCSSAPHLHFEVRIGRDAEVANNWASQRAVNPNLMFDI